MVVLIDELPPRSHLYHEITADRRAIWAVRHAPHPSRLHEKLFGARFQFIDTQAFLFNELMVEVYLVVIARSGDLPCG